MKTGLSLGCTCLVATLLKRSKVIQRIPSPCDWTHRTYGITELHNLFTAEFIDKLASNYGTREVLGFKYKHEDISKPIEFAKVISRAYELIYKTQHNQIDYYFCQLSKFDYRNLNYFYSSWKLLSSHISNIEDKFIFLSYQELDERFKNIIGKTRVITDNRFAINIDKMAKEELDQLAIDFDDWMKE